MRTIQAAAFLESEVDRDQEIALGEQIRIWREARDNGNTDPRIERQGQNAAVTLAKVNQRYLPNVLKKYFGYKTIDNDELWTTAFLGLVQAAKSYDPKKGYFWTYARWSVLHEIQNLLRTDYAIILPKKKFAEAQKDPELKALLTYTPINADIVGGTDDEEDEEEGWPCSGERLHEAIASLPAHLREIIERVYGIGCEAVTQTVIAQERGVSNTTISDQKKAAHRLIKKYLETPVPEAKGVEAAPEIAVVEQVIELPEPEPETVVEVAEVEEAPETESKAVDEVLEDEAVEWVEKLSPLDTIGHSPIESDMECPNCHAEIPEPPEGTKFSCSKCYSRYERFNRGLWTSIKSDWGYAAFVFKDRCLNLPHKPEQEHSRFEQRRIKTFNDLARTYHELKDKGDRYERVRARVLNLWRETDRYRLFDESAMERVTVWIEEVEIDSNRDTT